MNNEQEKEFAEWVDKTSGSKVKFYQCDCQIIYDDDGTKKSYVNGAIILTEIIMQTQVMVDILYCRVFMII